MCKLCQNEYYKEYRKSPRVKILAKEAQRRHRILRKDQVAKRTALWQRVEENRFIVFKQIARRRNLEVTITLEQFKLLLNSPCYYWSSHTKPEVGSGLDRIDNSLGYHITNVLPCCTKCNISRQDNFTVEEWKVAIEAVELLKLKSLKVENI